MKGLNNSLEELKAITDNKEDIELRELLVKTYEHFTSQHQPQDNTIICDEAFIIYRKMERGYMSKKPLNWWVKLYYKCKKVGEIIETKTAKQELTTEETKGNQQQIKMCQFVLWMRITSLSLDLHIPISY